MEKILSVIIPSYNMEGYLAKCLDSLIIEDFDKIEVLVVNDGSKDNTLKIAKEYEVNYPTSIIVIDKKNGNYGSCINAALPLATGKYIKILDADDSFDTENLKQLILSLAKVDVDLVLTRFVTIDPDNIITPAITYNLPYDVVLTSEDEDYFSINPHMHAVTYNRKVFDKFQYFQTEGISYTDTEWIFIPMHYVKSAIYYNLSVYKYLVGREGQTMDPKSFSKNIEHLVKIIKRLIGLTGNETSEKECKFNRMFIKNRLNTVYQCCLLSSYPYNNEKLIDLHDAIVSYDWALEHVMKLNYKGFKYVRYWLNSGKTRTSLALRLINFILRIKN